MPQGRKKRIQDAAVLVRMRQVELDDITAAAKKKTPGVEIGVGPFLRGGALRWAKEVLGTSIDDFVEPAPTNRAGK